MAGSPIKQARRMGVDIPSLGSGNAEEAKRVRDALARARVAQAVPPEDVPPDAMLVLIARGVLLAVAREVNCEPRDRIAAAKALIESTLKAPLAREADDLSHLTDDELLAQVEDVRQ